MAKQFISIVEISMLHDILNEIKTLFSFKIFNFINTNDLLKETNESSDIANSIIISKKDNHELLSSKKIVTNGLILLDDKPLKIGQLLDKINVLLIKKKYNFQSHLNIKSYSLNTNSRIISSNGNELKLTEREIDIILFLNEKKLPQSVDNLQNEVWRYSSTLDTHTVETHIYRLRKKIKSRFKDDNFILSLKEGYKI
jgi:DNA-binding response OmpR family regulator